MGVGLFGWFFEVLVLSFLKKPVHSAKATHGFWKLWEKSNPSAKIFKRSIRTSQKQTEFFILELPTVSSWKQQG